jgi:hypothetical protein
MSRDPGSHTFFKDIQRHRASQQDDIMEITEIEQSAHLLFSDLA